MRLGRTQWILVILIIVVITQAAVFRSLMHFSFEVSKARNQIPMVVKHEEEGKKQPAALLSFENWPKKRKKEFTQRKHSIKIRSNDEPIRVKKSKSPTTSPASDDETLSPKKKITPEPVTTSVVLHPKRSTALTAEQREALNVDKLPRKLIHLQNAALVVLCYDRPDYLTKTLQSVKKTKFSSKIQKFVSQDGDELETQAVAQSFGEDGFQYMTHPRTLPEWLHLNTSDSELKLKQTPSTMYLAAHYKWVLDQLFLRKNFSHVILLEDDMLVSKDFVAFFEMLAPLLDIDPTLWCISSWNDNGFRHLDLPENKFFRTSYFPGLGWMLKKELWLELNPLFPEDNWDHWMRASTTSKKRDCIAPFLSRNKNIGVGGATSNREFYQRYLKSVQRYTGPPIPFGDLTYLLRERYDHQIVSLLKSASTKTFRNIDTVTFQIPSQFEEGGAKAFIIPYFKEEFETLGDRLFIHQTPRTNYQQLTWLKFNDVDVFVIDRRTSNFAIAAGVKIRPHLTLKAVQAAKPGISCRDACMAYQGTVGDEEVTANWQCAQDQFDFINDCDTLAEQFEGCPYGCTQGWGEDIPNMETWEIGHRPQCLTTELVPSCDGSHPKTIRLCPCIAKQRQKQMKRSKKMVVVAAKKNAQSCTNVCEEYHQSGDEDMHYRCDPFQFPFLNTCETLKKNFPCERCDINEGGDLPNYVDNPEDNNHGKCLLLRDSSGIGCEGQHRSTRRLCPCVPE